jgi:hypothetical protein
MKKSRLKKRRRRTTQTGIREGFDRFLVLGGSAKLSGFMHYQLPRWTDEYEKMEVRDISWRIHDDIAELLARAYPTSVHDWDQQFEWRRPRVIPRVTYEDRLRGYGGIGKSISESQNPGLNERLFSPDENVQEQASKEYEEIVQRLLKEEPRAAANALVFIVKWAANYLENLYVRRPGLMKEVAKTQDLWPVNLGLRMKVVKGKPIRELTRSSFAREYLIGLELNSQCTFPTRAARNQSLRSRQRQRTFIFGCEFSRMIRGVCRLQKSLRGQSSYSRFLCQ